MEVIKSNFYEILPKVQTAIENSDFISIDCELTGLNTESNINAFDTQRQYYEKLLKNSKKFLPIQFGLCIFRYDKDLHVFKQQAYNFYIFPRPTNKDVPDHRFLCQASSIDFLISCGFDFNKLFKEGIPYLNSVEEDKYKENLADRQKIRANYNSTPIDDVDLTSLTIEDKSIVDKIFKEIEEYIVSDENEKILPKCNAFIRKLVYQKARNELKDKVNLETRLLENKDRVLVVNRIKSEEEQIAAEKDRVKQEEIEFFNCIGFSEIMKTIVKSGKLVVGHNMCLDLLHTIDKFLTPLPDDYDEFKELANYLFSNLLDTKYMSSVAPFKEFIDSSVLLHLLKSVSEQPFEMPSVQVEDDCQGYHLNKSKEHEAGYDAFITGLCFLSMWNYLVTTKKSDSVVDPFTHQSLLEPYKNKVFLMRLQDVPYIHLGGDDLTPSRDHVLYITFPKEWKHNDIIQLFSPFGNVYVAWIDQESAYVALHNRDQITLALTTLSQSDRYTVMSYSQRQVQISENVSLSCPSTALRRKRSIDNSTLTFKKRRIRKHDGDNISKIQSTSSAQKNANKVKSRSVENKIYGLAESFDENNSNNINPKTTLKTFEENSDWD